MGDRLAARHLLPGALDIDMDPLVIAGRVGEFVDLLLGHRVPVADPDLLADIGGEIGSAFDFQHLPLPQNPEPSYRSVVVPAKAGIHSSASRPGENGCRLAPGR